MREEEVKAFIDAGKSYWRMLSFSALAITLLLLIEQLVWGASWKISIVQVAILLAQSFLIWLLNTGKINFWWYFVVLMFSGVWAFVIGGSQMGDFLKGDPMAGTYALISLGLALFGLAIYAAYSPNVDAFLKLQRKIEESKSEIPS